MKASAESPNPRIPECLLVRFAHRRAVQPAEAAEQALAQDLAAEEEVGAGLQVERERQVLVDGLDAERAGGLRRGISTGRPSKPISPASGLRERAALTVTAGDALERLAVDAVRVV